MSIDGRTEGTAKAAAWPRIAVVVVSMLAVARFVVVWSHTPMPYPSFVGACERLRASGLPIQPADWFCQPQPWTVRAAFIGASLLVALAVVLPCALLASTGRRGTALLPLVAMIPALSHPGTFASEPLNGFGSWLTGPLATPIANVLQLCAPVVAISVVNRGRRVVHPPMRMLSAVGALIPLAGAAAIASTAGRLIYERHLDPIGGVGTLTIWPAVLAIFLFGMLLGPDRRWWPWSLAPIAILLSMGPASSLQSHEWLMSDWSSFGLAVPLAAAGLAGSAWRSLAMKLDAAISQRRSTSSSRTAPERRPRTSQPSRIRPRLIGNALAAGLLAVTVVLFVADPLPISIATALPTFLGERTAASDLRTRLNLQMAMEAMDRYRADHGSYEGFDAKAGAAIETSLAWQDGTKQVPYLTMAVVTARRNTARVAAISNGGSAYCLQREPAGAWFGWSDPPGYGTYSRPAALRDAIARCGDEPWTSHQTEIPEPLSCVGMDRSGGYLICRMVQVLIANTLRESKPGG